MAALPGPPVALVYRSGDGPAFRATLSQFFLCISAATLTLRYGTGLADTTDAVRAAAMAVAVVAGALLARPLAVRFSPVAVTRAALALAPPRGRCVGA